MKDDILTKIVDNRLGLKGKQIVLVWGGKMLLGTSWEGLKREALNILGLNWACVAVLASGELVLRWVVSSSSSSSIFCGGEFSREKFSLGDLSWREILNGKFLWVKLSTWEGVFLGNISTHLGGGDFSVAFKRIGKRNKPFFKWKCAKEYFSGRIVSKKFSGGGGIRSEDGIVRDNYPAEEFYVGETFYGEIFCGGNFPRDGFPGTIWKTIRSQIVFLFTESKEQHKNLKRTEIIFLYEGGGGLPSPQYPALH